MAEYPWWGFTLADTIAIPVMLVIVFLLTGWPEGLLAWVVTGGGVFIGHLIACSLSRRGKQ